MPQFGTLGGKHHKKKKKYESTNNRQLIFKEDGQDYALITAMLGHKRCTIKTSEHPNEEKIGIIRGNMRKTTNRVCLKDTVLVSLRDFQENKVDIIHVYNNDEVKSLIDYEEITYSFTQDVNDVYIEDFIQFKESHIDSL